MRHVTRAFIIAALILTGTSIAAHSTPSAHAQMVQQTLGGVVGEINAMTVEQNRSCAEWLIHEAWNKGALEAAAEHFLPFFTVHFRGVSQAESQESGRATLTNWRTGFPDLALTVGNMVAEGDLVAVNWRFTGTHTGHFHFGPRQLPPTGERVDFTEMLLLRFEEGRIAEMWMEFDFPTMLLQLGALPAAATPAGIG